MTTLLVKSLALVAGVGVGVTGAIGYGVFHLTSSTKEKNPEIKQQTVESFLKKKGLKLMANEDTKWTEKWNSFKSANQTTAPKEPWKFSKATLDESQLNSFKEQCLSLGKKTIEKEEDPIYVQVSTYCAKELETSEK